MRRKASVVASAKPTSDAELFPIVGIGASAGGLTAISELLQALPATPGMAFVVISHMDPKRQSMLDMLLATKTSMPVRTARSGDVVEPNQVYVIAPGKRLAVRGGVLRTAARGSAGPKPGTIDRFFASLAEDRRSLARGVVLSGTGSDGTEGLRLIRLAGGLGFAQAPGSAQFDGMPENAIRAGCVDFVLTPAMIAQQLLDLARLSESTPASASPDGFDEAGADDTYSEILGVLSQATHIDFSEYKDSTLRRRIARRMALQGYTSPASYLQHLHAQADEVRALYADLLIHVSSFFRDAGAFRALDRRVITPLVRRAETARPIRIWVPGCARGEEVYSIGMLLLDRLGPGLSGQRIQLFGSDVSAPDIDAARVGRFPEQIAADIKSARLKRYFDKTAGGYQVRPELRELCVFACHEIGSDPPFSNLDLISCRNLLIYFSRPLQDRVIASFHYALKPNGKLFLGRSESLAGRSGLFALLDKKHCIYERKAASTSIPPAMLRPVAGAGATAWLQQPAAPAGAVARDLGREVERALIGRYAPPGVYVDHPDLQIRAFIGDVSAYLQPATGQANLQLTRMLPATIALDIRAAIRTAQSSRRPVQRATDWPSPGGASRVVNLVVMRIAPAGDRRTQGYLVLFESASDPAPSTAAQQAPAKRASPRERSELARVRKQLAATREQLQTAVEEQEHAALELRSAHEESLSANEELKSSNEELQTAKEELQSANEELVTVNEELQSRNQQLDQLAVELSTLIAGVNIPIVQLDREQRVRRFSPAAQAAFNLIAADLGRGFGQIKPSIVLPELDALIAATIETGAVEQREVQDPSGRWHSLRLRPLRSSSKRIEGALIALVDIDASRRDVAAIVETISQPLLMLDQHFRVLSANPAFYRMFRFVPRDSRDVPLFELGNRRWNQPELHRLLKEILPQHRRFEDFRVEGEFPLIGRKVFRLSGQEIVSEGVGSARILIVFRDVTDEESTVRERLRDAREQENQRLAHELHDLSSGALAGLSMELVRLSEQVSTAPAAVVAQGLRAAQATVQALAATTHELARGIHPFVLVNLGLVKALIGECHAFEDRHAVQVKLHSSGTADHLPDAVALCVYRVVQEALSNIARHAKAGRINIRLGIKARALQLDIRDSGAGFDVRRAHAKGGLGLLGMRDRVAALGGTLAVQSAVGKGTVIKVVIPLEVVIPLGLSPAA